MRYPDNLNELVDWLESKGYTQDSGSLFDFIEDSIGPELANAIISKVQEKYNIINGIKGNNSMKFEKMCNGALNIYNSLIKENIDNMQVENYGNYTIRIGIYDENGTPLPTNEGEMSEINIDAAGDEAVWEKFNKLKNYVESEEFDPSNEVLGSIEGEI